MVNLQTTTNIIKAVLILNITLGSAAAAYSPPPSWLPMSMPSVTYNNATNKLAVQSKSAVLLNTNVNQATSQPGPGIASFDPVQPWAILNGTAFSRTLGWNDPGYQYTDIPANDPSSIIYKIKSIYGPDADIWIESLNRPSCLDSYLAVGMWGVNADGTQNIDNANPTGIPYSGIFGTLGSPARWRWDGVMDHNTYAVPFNCLDAPNKPFTTTYRLYIGDSQGNELLIDKYGNPVSSAAATTVWNWTGPAFVFSSQSGVTTNTIIESDVFIATGIPAPGTSSIAVTGGEYALSFDGGTTWEPWTSIPGTIANSNNVKVRLTSAEGSGVTSVTTLAIPGVPGPGEFRVTTTTVPDPAWPAKIKGGYDQPSVNYAYSIAPELVEPNQAVIMIKDGILAETFTANRNISVTLSGGYNTDFTAAGGVSVFRGASNIMMIKKGKVIVNRVYLRPVSP